jgi:hypothetical protein
MLLFYMPFYIFDGMLELYNAGMSALSLANKEPMIFMFEEDLSSMGRGSLSGIADGLSGSEGFRTSPTMMSAHVPQDLLIATHAAR